MSLMSASTTLAGGTVAYHSPRRRLSRCRYARPTVSVTVRVAGGGAGRITSLIASQRACRVAEESVSARCHRMPVSMIEPCSTRAGR